MNEKLNKQAVEAVHKNYGCQGDYPCHDKDYCQFCGGHNTAYDCNECGADEYYEGYVQALKDIKEKK